MILQFKNNVSLSFLGRIVSVAEKETTESLPSMRKVIFFPEVLHYFLPRKITGLNVFGHVSEVGTGFS